MPRSSRRFQVRVLGAVLAFSSALAGCSDLYYDRRETVSFGAGDANATASALQTIDPWPPGSENRDFGTNGPRMAGAIERYRTGRVIQPLGTSTSSVGYGAAPTSGQGGAPVTTGGSAPNN